MKDETGFDQINQPEPVPTVAADIEQPTVAQSVATETTTPEQTLAVIDREPAYVAPTSTESQQNNAVEPVAAGATPVQGSAPTGGKKKKRIIGSIIAGILLVLASTGAAAYTLWYQNPDKVLTDALINAAQAESAVYTGSINLINGQSATYGAGEVKSIKLTIDGKGDRSAGEINAALAVNYAGTVYRLTGSGVTDKDMNLYVKVNDVKKLLTSLAQKSGGSYSDFPSYITAIVDKIDGKWVRIGKDDLGAVDEQYEKTKGCSDEVIKKLESDKAMSDELVQIYRDNSFVVIKETLPAKNGSLGYVIDGDGDKYVAFAKAANKSKFVSELQKCDDSFKLSEEKPSTITGDATYRAEVWVDRWSHELTRVYVKGTSEATAGDVTFEPKFNRPVSVTTPTDFIEVSELKTMYEDAMTQYMQSGVESSTTTSTSASLSSQI